MNRLIVFDCDGTLVDSQANIIRAMLDTFDRHGLAHPDHHLIRRVVGLSLTEAMQALLPDAEDALHEALAQDYKSAFQRLRGNGGLLEEPLFPGIRALLETLAGSGHLLGIATGKSDRGLAMCLDHHGLASHFHTLQTADRHPSKPHPAMLEAAMADVGAAPSETIMLGDTLFDMEMAVGAGAMAVGVDWGYHDSHELLAAGARTVLSEAHDLLPLIAEA